MSTDKIVHGFNINIIRWLHLYTHTGMGLAISPAEWNIPSWKGMDMRSRGKSENPDHTKQVAALNRVIGQLEAVKKMMIDRKYCPDIIHQIRAARGGLVSAEVMVLATHISNCVRDAIQSGDEVVIEEKAQEVSKYVKGLVV
ncbi:MAG: metal-sensitive transcriptional regulator [Bdellovibrionales bacterium]|nr:metal-sensitive transcriptional regulator [Bdellovibrionales bacterium]